MPAGSQNDLVGYGVRPLVGIGKGAVRNGLCAEVIETSGLGVRGSDAVS